jgi:hypothetical protein
MSDLGGVSRDDLLWTCCRCSGPMEMGSVELTYLGNSFWIDLPRCPTCGLFLVPEELATGRMNEVELLLEDK